ncbi:MAG: hypothetical protein ACREFP_19050 [Acetobacteraceae bacterium]
MAAALHGAGATGFLLVQVRTAHAGTLDDVKRRGTPVIATKSLPPKCRFRRSIFLTTPPAKASITI